MRTRTPDGRRPRTVSRSKPTNGDSLDHLCDRDGMPLTADDHATTRP